MTVILEKTLLDIPRPAFGGIEAFSNFMWGKQPTDWVLPVLWSIARKYKNSVIGEIGTQTGISTAALGMAARDVGGKVYSMDINPNQRKAAETNAILCGVRDQINFIEADSRYNDFPEPLDVLFIDGDHSYEGVKADYERHSVNVKENGIILFHDACSCRGVERFVDEIGAYTIPIDTGLSIMARGYHGNRIKDEVIIEKYGKVRPLVV